MFDVFPDRTAIMLHQLAVLQAMWAEVIPHNRFYVQKLMTAGIPPCHSERSEESLSTMSNGEILRSAQNDVLTLEDFLARVPFTTKQELVDDQHNCPPYGTNLTYPVERYVRFHQTSGTTGVPLRWLDTPESWNWMVDNWTHVMAASGVTPNDRVFCAFSFGPFIGFWLAFEAGVRMGCLCIPGGGMSSAARLRVMLDNDITVLCCTPTYAIRLAEVADEEGVDLAHSKVRIIIAAGEPGASIPATRARIESLWRGAQVRDHHGMTEIGAVSFECPARRGVLHVMEHAYIPEVIDPKTGQRVGAGETGELVLTNLGRLGSPLIRYRTGDIVKTAAATPCVCGRYDLALEGGILGRTDDMVVVRGVNLYPSAMEAILRGFDTIAEYRVEVLTERSMLELRLQLEPKPDCADPAELARDVEAALRNAFDLRVPVALVPPGTLPRFELKAQRWVRTG
jgi:phenylacetate-CoA ligase